MCSRWKASQPSSISQPAASHSTAMTRTMEAGRRVTLSSGPWRSGPSTYPLPKSFRWVVCVWSTGHGQEIVRTYIHRLHFTTYVESKFVYIHKSTMCVTTFTTCVNLSYGRSYEAEICTILLLLRCSFWWYPFLPKSKFSDFGQKPWTITHGFFFLGVRKKF